MSRTQELPLAVSDDGGHTYREDSDRNITFHRLMRRSSTNGGRCPWKRSLIFVSSLIKPDKGNKPSRATMTSLKLQ